MVMLHRTSMEHASATTEAEGPYTMARVGHRRRPLVDDHRLRLRWPDASEQRELDGEAARIETERQSEQIELDALFPTCGDARDAEHAHLPASAARRQSYRHDAEIVLADSCGRQIDAQLRNLTQHECGERVRVRAGPDAIALRV